MHYRVVVGEDVFLVLGADDGLLRSPDHCAVAGILCVVLLKGEV